MKAYILSEEHGTVQIGRTVYCLPTGKSFQSTRKGLKGLPCYDVQDNSWTAARIAAEKHKNSKGGEK
jgi:hypothetical protein